ncbi:hypothetical protein AVEN_36796-1 [Araneus ventricosus]|uniref:Transposase Tc1-like domain-containing protein n=1 Tax=Araneus ventricosus TaxID=182803 RepID=A0A4Y2RC74_ARAVE|nr:hypothetical protein AVEN_36796-1 [Araneus ventricosus]
MAGYQDLSNFERDVIVGAREMGHSISEVVMKFGYSRTTIHECTVNIGYPVKHQISVIGGTEKKTSKERDRRRLTRNLKRVRRATLPQIAASLSVGALTSVTVRTVELTIIDMGFRSRSAIRVLLLTARHTALCLAWARQHRHWTVDGWKHVAWFDESRFQLFRADGHVRIWRQPHESMAPTCQQGTVQSDRASVMVCSARIGLDMGPLICLETSLTGTDMNIIEPIWDAFQRAVQKRSPPPRTPMDLRTVLQNSWCELPPGYLQTLVEIMPRRIAALLRDRGDPTRY